MHLSPELLLRAYQAGIFPMADDAAADELFWYDPPERTVFPLDAFHVPQRLRRTVRRRPYRITLNYAFPATIAACAAPDAARKRERTWINAEIIALYTALHRAGHAHSIEAWAGDALVGGLYGVQIGGAFFGESMFSHADNASKIALVYLAALLRHSHFRLLDCQFMTNHLRQFGAVTISRAAYHRQLAQACKLHCGLDVSGAAMGGTYPGTGTGSAVEGSTGAVPVAAGAALDAVAMGFLQAMTQTS